jgi:hypothetical protein
LLGKVIYLAGRFGILFYTQCILIYEFIDIKVAYEKR